MTSHFCLICLLWLTAVSIAETNAKGSGFLTYDPQERQLRFQCPEPGSKISHSLLHARVSRVPKKGGNATVLAELTFTEGQGIAQSRYDRVRVPEGPIDYLSATLEHVTCYDAVTFTYTCVIQIDDSGVPKGNEDHFQFVGEITQPVISQQPLKSRYIDGEVLSLNCTASVGTQDNGLVWEEGFPGGPFNPVTRKEDPETGKAFNEVQEDHPRCIRQSFFPLKFRVKAEDDGKIFRCRLRKTNQTTSIAIAVETDKEKCVHHIQNDKQDDPGPGTVDLQVTNTESRRIVGDRVGDGEERSDLSTATSLIIVIAVLVVLVAVAASVSVVLYRQGKKTTPQPLMILETPASSEISYADRHLPSLPDLTEDTGRNETMPKWITDNPHHSHLENHLNSNINGVNHPDLTSASIYVSMSAVDRCTDLGTGSDVAQDGSARAHPEMETEQSEVCDLAPDMRSDRSESLYSNQAPCVDEMKVEEGEERDESAYVRSFVDLI